MNENAELNHHEETQSSGGAFGFIREWKMLFYWLGGMVMIVALGGIFGSLPKEPAPVIPDKVETHNMCEVTDKGLHLVAKTLMQPHVSTSCGYFQISSENYEKIQLGSRYNLKTSQFQGKGTPMVVEFKEATNKAP